MTVKELRAMKDAENIKFDLMIKIRELLDEGKKAYKAGGGDEEWEEVEEEIREKVFEG